jgi:hypothetical protein
MEKLDSKILAEIEKLGGNIILVAVLDKLKNWAG